MSIDFAMVAAYMILTAVVGYKYGSGIKTLRDYAIGRGFSTAAIASTIIATWVSGSWFVVAMSNSYRDGIVYLLANIGNVFCLLIVGYIFAPRMREFLGDLSVAETMGKLYGPQARIITSVVGIILSISVVAMQMKILSSLLTYFGYLNPEFSLIITAFVVTFYCMFGGISSVIFTDVIQFVCIVTAIIPIFLSIWYNVSFADNPDMIQIAKSKLLSLKSVSGVDYLTYFILGLIPALGPATFHRILIAQDTEQIRRSFSIAAFALLIFLTISSMIGVILFAHNQSIEYSQIFPYVVDNFASSGVVKGCVFVAVLSMAMSTLDSHLNSAGIMFSHDILGSIKPEKSQEFKLRSSRIFVGVAGAFATYFALRFEDFLTLDFFANNAYVPVVTVPLILAILGFRTSSHKPAIAGMVSGFLTVLVWRNLFMESTGFDSLVPAVIVHLLVFFVVYYFVRSKNDGWIGPRDLGPVKLKEIEASRRYSNIKIEIINFVKSLFYIKRNNPSIKVSSYNTMLLGILMCASYFNISVYGLQVQSLYYIQMLSCSIGALLISSPLWYRFIKEYMPFITLYSLIYLIYSTSMLMFYHGFSPVSIVSLLVNAIACSFFCRTQTAILVILFGMLSSTITFSLFLGEKFIFFSADMFYFASYTAFALSFILMPLIDKQQQQVENLAKSEERLEHINKALNSQLDIRDENLKKALDMQNEILRNVNHEIRTPLGAIKVNSDMMVEYVTSNHSDEKLVKILLENKKAVDRFFKYASNMLDLSSFKTNKMLFEIKLGNFKELLENIASEYQNVSIEYDTSVPSKIQFDELKMRSLFDHLIANSNEYGGHGAPIIISVSMSESLFIGDRQHDMVHISVRDYGKGVAKEELELIFEPFKIGSKTKTTAGGKGIGLSLCSEIIAGHVGKIWAVNAEGQGLIVNIIIPVSHPSDGFLSSKKFPNSIGNIDISHIISQIDMIEEKFGGKIPKILMIDDEKIVLHSGEMIIKSLGYDFIGLRSKSEAIEYIMSSSFDADVVLLDMMLTDGSGLDIMRAVRNKLSELNVPVVIQSGLSAGDESIDETLKLGAKTFLSKPYSRSHVQKILEELL